jgi:hypothetical protein
MTVKKVDFTVGWLWFGTGRKSIGGLAVKERKLIGFIAGWLRTRQAINRFHDGGEGWDCFAAYKTGKKSAVVWRVGCGSIEGSKSIFCG